jgi:hypothetical protein
MLLVRGSWSRLDGCGDGGCDGPRQTDGDGCSRRSLPPQAAQIWGSTLRSLRPRSRRPNCTRCQQWTTTQEQVVRDLRQRYPRSGTAKLVYLLRAQGMVLSASTIWRILASLKRCWLLRAPHALRVRQCRSHGPTPRGCRSRRFRSMTGRRS